MNTSDAVYLDGLEFFTDIVDRYPADGWQLPSPCQGWTAVDVVGHIGAAVRLGTELLSGDTPLWQTVQPPGDAVHGDPAQWWRALVAPARNAVQKADVTQVVDSPMGRRSIADGLMFPAIDLFVHGWDLGRAGGLDVEIPHDVIDFSRDAAAGIPEEQLRSPHVFAAEVTPPPDATASEAFLAWTGRDPRWSPA